MRLLINGDWAENKQESSTSAVVFPLFHCPVWRWWIAPMNFWLCLLLSWGFLWSLSIRRGSKGQSQKVTRRCWALVLLLLVQVKERGGGKKQDWARGFVLKWNSVLIDVYLRHGIKLVAYLLEFKSGVILSFRSRKSRWSNGFSFTDIPETRGCDLILVSAFQNTMFNMWLSLLKSWQTANGEAVRGVKVFLFWPFRDESEPESELDVCSAINHPTLRLWERNEGVGLLFSFLKSMCICVASRHPHRKSCPLCWLQNNAKQRVC